MQPAAVHGSEPAETQNASNVHIPLRQSLPVAHGVPPRSAQTPLLQLPLAQSLPALQGAQTFAAQRCDPHAASSPHRSPSASLQNPARQTPFTQSEFWVQA